MEELVSIYNDVLDHDSKSNSVRLFVYKNKEDFVKKYVEENLMRMKVSEPNHTEKYENTFKKYLDNINMIISPFGEDEIIIVGVFGDYVDKIDIGKSDVRVYSIKDISFLIDDMEDSYK